MRAAPAEQLKRRPCLALDAFDLNGTTFVELAYGTSAPTEAIQTAPQRVRS
ncbi:MAG: hypothetical protein ACJAVT_000136 [Yoonia sp.]